MIDKKPFNGRLCDVRVEIMSDPYDRLMDYGERGHRLQQASGNFVRNSERSEQTIERYFGFSVLANTVRSGLGILGSTGAEVWIAPLANNRSKSTEIKTATTRTKRKYTHPSVMGKALERFVTHPVFDKLPLEALGEQTKANSQKIYLALLAMPSSTDMTR